MFTAAAGLILPSTTTGSFPRPRWFDVGMWGKPLDTCMLDVRFREKFQDALAVMIGDQERAGLDILTHGDLHVDEDMAGRAWHHYPLQRWAGFEGDHFQPEETTAPWLHYPSNFVLGLISDADAGVLLTWSSNVVTESVITTQFGMAITTGTSVNVLSGPSVPGQQASVANNGAATGIFPVVPILQREDGSFIGIWNPGGYHVSPPLNMVAFDSSKSTPPRKAR